MSKLVHIPLIIPPVVNPNVVEYVEWTHKEEGFSHIGILTHISSTHIIIHTKFGDMTVARDDGEMNPSTKKAFDATGLDKSDIPIETIITTTVPKSGSRTEQAADIINAMPDSDKKDIIDALVNQMQITRGNASIYYSKLTK